MEEQPHTSNLSTFRWQKFLSMFNRQKNQQKISRTVGIEDIDHTWVFGEDQHNMAMCASFKNAGIIHHFFCSDRDFLIAK